MRTFIMIGTALILSASAASATATYHQRHHHIARFGGYKPSPFADPTHGPGTPQLHYYQSIGRCVIDDEGYGRYTFCGNE